QDTRPRVRGRDSPMEVTMSDSGRNRRRASRLAGQDDHGITSIRIRPGHPASVIDVSSHGAMLETTHRLLPGTTVELQIEAGKARASVRGRVVRCAVAEVRASSLSYRGAVAFDRHLHWFATDGRAMPSTDACAALPGRAPATPFVA